MATIIPKSEAVPTVDPTALPLSPSVGVAEQPAMTSQNLNPEPTQSMRALRQKAFNEGAFIHDASVVAKPLSIPGSNVKLKNPNISLRWVNFKAGNGLQLQRMLNVGFAVAKDTDVVIPDIPFTDGAFKNGDLILMKIARSEYQAALKWNAELAMRRVGREAVLQQGRQNIKEAVSSAGGPPSLKQKISAFIPNEADMEHTPLAAEGEQPEVISN